ncbi:hypothetical protein GMLC_00830 [Geomonas limicola]|uniref:Uncharacterized protein n=1 Tax=Geomonas limicola TaxID=2740186 RepID=A0A6V8N3F5_9BACT|nr:hypothetical protein [Geomonas limicola]GFO66504.1 hypothetical protein GMLC_00830 [Geomonas limicola]
MELLCPVTAPEIAEELRAILECHDSETRFAWEMISEGRYR